MGEDPGYRFAHPGFCNGLWLVNPFLRHPLAGNLLLYGIGAMAVTWWGSRESRPANLRKRDRIVGCVDNPDDGLAWSIVPAKGLRIGKAGVVPARKLVCSLL